MERVARLIGKHKDSRKVVGEADLVKGIWPLAVGPAVARHTSNLRVVREKLIVDVEDAIWQQQLFRLSAQILARIQKCMDSAAIQDIEFRIGVPRREPQRSETIGSASFREDSDEADGIRDPVLKKLYRLSRKRATA